jgi:molecular chaperone GrpE (heat shock protein)
MKKGRVHKMPNYKITLFINEANIARVRKLAESNFPDTAKEIEKINTSPSRSERLSEAESLFEEAKSTVEELRDEMENWKDSLPDNFQNGDKADRIQEALDALEEIINNMESCEFGSVDFPGMMG